MFNCRPLMIASLALSTTALACTENAQPAASSTTAQTQALAAEGGDAGARGPRHPHGPPDMPPPGGPGGPHGGPHGPPPAEAFTACDGKAAAATCSVTLGDHTMNGTCLAPPPDSGETRLACAPPHGPGGPGGPPPSR
jgi:hypothetical protein